jgi:thiosulfate dehydrogenase [quinone] large subunit
MLTMLGVGAAVMLGVALRPAAAAGTLVLALMWSAELPLAQTTAAGTPSGSTNPLVDYHVIYALALIVIAAAGAGHHWGLAAWWARLPWIRTQHWAR